MRDNSAAPTPEHILRYREFRDCVIASKSLRFQLCDGDDDGVASETTAAGDLETSADARSLETDVGVKTFL